MRPFMSSQQPRTGSRVGATYSIPISSFGVEELADEKKRLTLQARTSFGAPPPPFQSWFEHDGVIHLPRFYGLGRYGLSEVDERVDGDVINITFQGTLSDVQTRASTVVQSRHLCDNGNGGTIISLPCGLGKTVLGVHIVAARNRKTCILVHKAVIRDQWKDSFERFCPGVKVGFIQGKLWQVDGYDVVIAMVMTLAKRDIPMHMFDSFGVVIADEAHHMAAPVMNIAMRGFRARWIIGLTATKDRPDGLTPLLHWCLGPEGFRVERDSENVKVSMALFSGATREILSRSNGKPLVSVMITNLALHARRNAFIADRIVTMRNAGRVIMILSDRRAQLDILHTFVVQRGVPEADVGIFKGGMRDADREEQLARPVVMCTYGMANEGVDKREADTCVMATPKGRVIQCIGRIQRPCATKQHPLVLDICDDVSLFIPLRWGRQRMYGREKYDVQVLEHDCGSDMWHV